MHFSIVIPTFNRPAQLRDCLESLAGLRFPMERFEVVVVDDGGSEPVDDAVASFTDRLRVTLLQTTNQGPGAARNAGAEIARGRYLVFTDDDCQPRSDWLSKLDEEFARHEDCMIGGRTVNRLTDNLWSETSQLVVEMAYSFYNRTPQDASFFASNNMAVPAEIFSRLGGFDPSFRIASEDRELCNRWRFAEHRLVYAPNAVIYHEHSLTFSTFCRQHFRYGRGAAQYHRVRSRGGSELWRHHLQFYAYLPLLFRNSISRFTPRQAISVVALLGIWQFVNAAGFFFEKLIGRFSESA